MRNGSTAQSNKRRQTRPAIKMSLREISDTFRNTRGNSPVPNWETMSKISLPDDGMISTTEMRALMGCRRKGVSVDGWVAGTWRGRGGAAILTGIEIEKKMNEMRREEENEQERGGTREQLTRPSSRRSRSAAPLGVRLIAILAACQRDCHLIQRQPEEPLVSCAVVLWLFALKILFIAITRICAKMPAMSRCRYIKCNCQEKGRGETGMNPFCLQRNKRIMV